MSKAADTATAAPKREVHTTGFRRLLDEHLRAGYQVMFIPTSEENRVEAEIGFVAKALKTNVITWDCAEGFDYAPLRDEANRKKFSNPVNALAALTDPKIFKPEHVFVFRDLDDFTIDAKVRRILRSHAEGNRLVNKEIKRPLIILSPKLTIHDKLKSSIAVIDFSLPTEEELFTLIDFLRKSIDPEGKGVAIPEELQRALAINLLGLTCQEAENCVARCLVRHGGFKEEMLATVKEEKASIVKRSECLTYIPEQTVTSMGDIGGWDLYRSWLERRKLAYTADARKHKIVYPKGCAIIGLPGTGKSVVAKATSQILGLPAYILDIGSLFGSLVGESEQRTRDVLKQIDAQQGCVLVIDEADKALGNAHTGQGDSGVTKRVFGTILSWLAENQSKTFVIMTLNRTDGLPPELTRAGRFDAMFYTSLPNESERRMILEIHLRKQGVDVEALDLDKGDWKQLIKSTAGFVGSELEVAVTEARYFAFQESGHGNPTFDNMEEAIAAIVPLTERDPEGMNKILSFCEGKAQPVTTPSLKNTTKSRSRSVTVDS